MSQYYTPSQLESMYIGLRLAKVPVDANTRCYSFVLAELLCQDDDLIKIFKQEHHGISCQLFCCNLLDMLSQSKFTNEQDLIFDCHALDVISSIFTPETGFAIAVHWSTKLSSSFHRKSIGFNVKSHQFTILYDSRTVLHMQNAPILVFLKGGDVYKMNSTFIKGLFPSTTSSPASASPTTPPNLDTNISFSDDQCKCTICTAAEKEYCLENFGINTCSISSPETQFLLKTFAAYDYLRFLGLDTHEWRMTLLEVFRLSIICADFESAQKNVGCATIFLKDVRNPQKNVQQSTPHKPGKSSFACQKPIKVGIVSYFDLPCGNDQGFGLSPTDSFRSEAEQTSQVHIITNSNSQELINEMILYLLTLRKKIIERKSILLKNIFTKLNGIETAHKTFFSAWRDQWPQYCQDDPVCENTQRKRRTFAEKVQYAFDNGLWGKIKKHFTLLEKRCFTYFHGFSNYDGPLCLPYLAKGVQDLNVQPCLKLSRQGSRIKHLTFGGIVFLDSITSFCASPVSLSSLAKTCQVGGANSSWLEKGIFHLLFLFFLSIAPFLLQFSLSLPIFSRNFPLGQT